MQDRLREQFVRDQLALMQRAEARSERHPSAGVGIWRRAAHAISRLSRWLDDSLLGALLGGLVIFGWLIATPVLLPLFFEVMQ